MGREKNTLRLWAVLFWLVVWQMFSMVLAAAYPYGHLLLASPLSVLLRLGELARTAAFWQTVLWSAVRIFGGFLASVSAAVLCAALAAWKPWFRELLAPVAAVIKAVPVASFIILALVWLDSRQLSFFISALTVFPPVYLGVLEGISHTDRHLLEMARVFRVPFFRQIRHLYLPQTAPYFRAAVSAALGLCWKSGAAAEVIGLPSGSMGERLYTAKVYFQTPDLFAWTAVIVAASVILEHLVLYFLEQLVRKAGG